MPRVRIHSSTQCAVEKAPTGSQLLTCYFFSFAVPSLKYLWDIFNHTAAVNMRVGPFQGSCFRQVVSGMGNTIFFTFSFLSSSDVRAFLSLMGFKKSLRDI